MHTKEERIYLIRKLQDANMALTGVYLTTDRFLEELKPIQTSILTMIKTLKDEED